MKKMKSGVAPDEKKSSHAGFTNSQRPGSSVIIFSRGTQPINPHLPITHSTDEYVSFSPVFSMELGDVPLAVVAPHICAACDKIITIRPTPNS
jgi:hypothetical protein